MFRIRIVAVVLATFLFACSDSEETTTNTELTPDDLTPVEILASVDPLIGTGGHGHTYPGVSRPFGMVQLSPDTRLDGWDGCSGYHNSDNIIYGFSHTHLSGTGVSDYGDILLMPTTDQSFTENGQTEEGEDLALGSGGYRSAFDKSKETAEAGLYQVHLDTWDVDVRLTATEHTGFHEYKWNQEDAKRFVHLNLLHRDKVISSGLEQISATEFRGHRISHAWATRQHVYFVIRFSEPIVDWKKIAEQSPADLGVFEFAAGNQPIYAKVGISAVDEEGALKNLEQELPGWDFDATVAGCQKAWNDELDCITVKGGSAEQQTIFYSALYHSFLNPNLFSDVDGRFRGMDDQVHTLPEGEKQYTIFSLWDTFRGTHPLFTIVQQDRTREFLQTFQRQYDTGGKLPIWELSGNYTGCMIGYHAIPVIADAYVKGIDGYEIEPLYEAMKHSAEEDILGLPSYKKFGYIPAGDEPESVSKTLEYAYDDWCIAQVAKALGKNDEYRYYLQRAQSYKNLYDPETGFMRAKMNGSWFSPFDPAEVNYNYTEANGWQYSLFAPQDVSGLMKLMGGKEKLDAHLDAMFSAESETCGRDQVDITGLIGQYAHGNEPSHHMAYLYNYVGKPWKTQEMVQRIMADLYTDQPDGLSGNEDCGQMSSWYVLSALGFYPVTPGDDIYAIGSPVFPEATINLENGNAFTIRAKGVSENNKYIQSATLNGEPYSKSYLEHGTIMAGGELVFVMGSAPNQDWGSADTDLPVSSIDEHDIIPAPFFDAPSRTFTESMEIKLGVPADGFEICYTTDGSEPQANSPRYDTPISLDATTTVKARTVSADGETGVVLEETYFKIEGGRSITLNCEYANQYAAGGDNALIDYQRGANNYRTGHWQGYQGQDLDAVVDLGEEKALSSVSIGFLQDIKSWIWFPGEVRFEGSVNGSDFVVIGTVKNKFPNNAYGSLTQTMTSNVNGKKFRYVRVVATNPGPCPEWHLGAGGESWLFADEIVFEFAE